LPAKEREGENLSVRVIKRGAELSLKVEGRLVSKRKRDFSTSREGRIANKRGGGSDLSARE
jgi:hypothetical protein